MEIRAQGFQRLVRPCQGCRHNEMNGRGVAPLQHSLSEYLMRRNGRRDTVGEVAGINSTFSEDVFDNSR